jgi:hypothetical protein
MVAVVAVLSLAGWSESTPAEMVLYSFLGGNDGQGPGSLIAAGDGAFYGRTYNGAGGSCVTPRGGGPPIFGCGTVFKLTPPINGGNRLDRVRNSIAFWVAATATTRMP